MKSLTLALLALAMALLLVLPWCAVCVLCVMRYFPCVI